MRQKGDSHFAQLNRMREGVHRGDYIELLKSRHISSYY